MNPEKLSRPAFVVGALSGFLVSVVAAALGALEVDPTVTAGNAIQVLATLAIGVVVAAYFQREATSERKEKDIVFRYLDESIKGLERLEPSANGGRLDDIKPVLRAIQLNVDAASSLVRNLKYSDAITRLDDLKIRVKAIRLLTTATPLDDDDRHPLRVGAVVERDVISFTPERSSQIIARIQDLRSGILDAQLSVNRA